MRSSVLLFAVLLTFRLAMIGLVEPLNAPDEVGHLILVNSLAQGKLMTLEEERQYQPSYPYAIFSPVPYLPYAAGLKIASCFDPSVLQMQKPEPHFRAKTVYAARLGGLVWFGAFAFFLLLLAWDLPPLSKTCLVAVVGLLPQLVYTQSYVNLDAMGTAVMLLLVWALKERRTGWVAMAGGLAILSKLNYLCLLLLPAWLLWEEARGKPRVLLRKVFFTFGIPVAVTLPWFAYSYWVNTVKYGSLLGVGSLQSLYTNPPGGWQVFTRHFLGLTLNSAFGVFGYFNQPLPSPFFWIWKGLIAPGGAAFLLFFALKKTALSQWHRGFLAVVLSNWVLHFAASFEGALSPQGRYVFPASCILLSYWVYGLERIGKIGIGRVLLCVLIAFMVASAAAGIYYSAGPPP